MQLPGLATAMLMQVVVPSCLVYVRDGGCRRPPGHVLVQRPSLDEICIGGQSLAAVTALLVYTENEHLTGILVCGALTKPILVLAVSGIATSLLRAAISARQLQTRAVREPITEAKSVSNAHHWSNLLPKPHSLHYLAQQPTSWSTLLTGIL